jgi:hypothetical protein
MPKHERCGRLRGGGVPIAIVVDRLEDEGAHDVEDCVAIWREQLGL